MKRMAFLLTFVIICCTIFNTQIIYADPPTQIEGTWIQASDGRWWYRHNDGSYTTDDWEYINSSWYHFDENGWMQTGWLYTNGSWYYLADSGAMRTGWIYINNSWYYLSDSGAMVIGWKYIGGYWYYFNSGGDMRTSTLYSSSRRYLFYESGRLRSTEIQITRQRQEQSNWCWAACAVMVGTYHTSVPKTQSYAVQYAKGSIVNAKGSINDTIQALYYASNYTKNGLYIGISNFSYNTAASQIDANQMFIMRILWNNNSGAHMVVGAGYDHYYYSIFIIDPYDNCVSNYYTYSSLKNGTQLQSGTGKWVSSIIY